MNSSAAIASASLSLCVGVSYESASHAGHVLVRRGEQRPAGRGPAPWPGPRQARQLSPGELCCSRITAPTPASRRYLNRCAKNGVKRAGQPYYVRDGRDRNRDQPEGIRGDRWSGTDDPLHARRRHGSGQGGVLSHVFPWSIVCSQTAAAHDASHCLTHSTATHSFGADPPDQLSSRCCYAGVTSAFSTLLNDRISITVHHVGAARCATLLRHDAVRMHLSSVLWSVLLVRPGRPEGVPDARGLAKPVVPRQQLPVRSHVVPSSSFSPRFAPRYAPRHPAHEAACSCRPAASPPPRAAAALRSASSIASDAGQCERDAQSAGSRSYLSRTLRVRSHGSAPGAGRARVQATAPPSQRTTRPPPPR